MNAGARAHVAHATKRAKLKTQFLKHFMRATVVLALCQQPSDFSYPGILRHGTPLKGKDSGYAKTPRPAKGEGFRLKLIAKRSSIAGAAGLF